MTPKERAAMQQALEALIESEFEYLYTSGQPKRAVAIRTLREALAEQAEQEPVAWTNYNGAVNNRLNAAPQPVQEPVFKVGNLVTINQDPYPALGKLFVQLWDGDDLIARVYADDEETLNKRVATLNSAHVQQAEQEPVADVFKFLLGEGELEGCGFGDKPDNERGNLWWRKHLRKALAEQAEQEPVYAFRRKGLDSFCTCDKERYEELAAKPWMFEVTIFYAAPVRTKDLTDDEIESCSHFSHNRYKFARAVIAAYKEKNK